MMKVEEINIKFITNVKHSAQLCNSVYLRCKKCEQDISAPTVMSHQLHLLKSNDTWNVCVHGLVGKVVTEDEAETAGKYILS